VEQAGQCKRAASKASHLQEFAAVARSVKHGIVHLDSTKNPGGEN